jgi:hypothetical protein
MWASRPGEARGGGEMSATPSTLRRDAEDIADLAKLSTGRWYVSYGPCKTQEEGTMLLCAEVGGRRLELARALEGATTTDFHLMRVASYGAPNVALAYLDLLEACAVYLQAGLEAVDEASARLNDLVKLSEEVRPGYRHRPYERVCAMPTPDREGDAR